MIFDTTDVEALRARVAALEADLAESQHIRHEYAIGMIDMSGNLVRALDEIQKLEALACAAEAWTACLLETKNAGTDQAKELVRVMFDEILKYRQRKAKRS